MEKDFIQPKLGDDNLVMLSELRTMPYRDRIRRATVEQLDAHPELSVKPKIYIASKAAYRPRWREFQDKGYDIVSSWIHTDDRYTDDPTGLDYAKLWQTCENDVRKCDVLVIYSQREDHLKGALVELGIALGLGKEIIACGDLTDKGSWMHHPRVSISDKSVEDLMIYIYG